ncbi:MAG: hypothetical protein ACNS61_08250 [Candidatus Wenzhouxiangella sp. M2_3B_020]
MTTAVIINVDTYPVTALAVLSLRARTELPILLVDCSRRASERKRARALAGHLGIDYRRQPLASHGRTLDRLFESVEDDKLLLMDSDAELLDASVVTRMAAELERPDVYGAGFMQKTDWMVDQRMPWGLYRERMWLPFCLLRVAPIREVLAAGGTFDHFTIYNDLPGFPRISRMLALRGRLPGGDRMRLRMLDHYRRSYDGERPSIVHWDTGAAVHARLTSGGWSFGSLEWSLQRRCVTHHHGVTRNALNWFDTNSSSRRRTLAWARRRLDKQWGAGLPAALRR